MRSVALIDYHKMNFAQRSLIVNTNLRIKTVQKWKDIVYELIDIIPIIILDTRYPTGPVIEEAQFLFTHSHVSKVMFLLEPNHESPVLDRLGVDPVQNALQTATESNLSDRLQQFIRSRQTPHLYPNRHTLKLRYEKDSCPRCGKSFEQPEANIPREAVLKKKFEGKAVTEIMKCRECGAMYCWPDCCEMEPCVCGSTQGFVSTAVLLNVKGNN